MNPSTAQYLRIHIPIAHTNIITPEHDRRAGLRVRAGDLQLDAEGHSASCTPPAQRGQDRADHERPRPLVRVQRLERRPHGRVRSRPSASGAAAAADAAGAACATVARRRRRLLAATALAATLPQRAPPRSAPARRPRGPRRRRARGRPRSARRPPPGRRRRCRRRSRRSRRTAPGRARRVAHQLQARPRAGPAWSASRAPARRRCSRRLARASICAGVCVDSPTSRSGPTIARARATGMSSWPTCTPSAPACDRQIRAVVDDQQRVVLGARRLEPPRRRDQLRVVAVLRPQLHDVDAAAQRGVQELVGHGVADQVQPGVRQAVTAVDHGAQSGTG